MKLRLESKKTFLPLTYWFCGESYRTTARGHTPWRLDGIADSNWPGNYLLRFFLFRRRSKYNTRRAPAITSSMAVKLWLVSMFASLLGRLYSTSGVKSLSFFYNGGMAQLKITRREWAAAIGASATATAQVTTLGADQTADEILTQARAEVRQSAERLEKFKLPMTAEPAFIFKP